MTIDHDAGRDPRKVHEAVRARIRLFANMTAGHVMVLALIRSIFMFGSVLIGDRCRW